MTGALKSRPCSDTALDVNPGSAARISHPHNWVRVVVEMRPPSCAPNSAVPPPSDAPWNVLLVLFSSRMMLYLPFSFELASRRTIPPHTRRISTGSRIGVPSSRSTCPEIDTGRRVSVGI